MRFVRGRRFLAGQSQALPSLKRKAVLAQERENMKRSTVSVDSVSVGGVVPCHLRRLGGDPFCSPPT